jgi:RNA polymerase sigma factor (sigma-70 family)
VSFHSCRTVLVIAESSLVQHLRSGQDQRARIGEAVAAFRRLAPSDYGHFLATIENDLSEHVPQLEGGAPQLLLEAGPTSAGKSPTIKPGSLREAVLKLISDGQPRTTVEIRGLLEATRPVKAPTLNTEIFTLRKLGLLRSEGNGRATRHTIVARALPTTMRSGGKHDRAPRAPRARKPAADDEDSSAPAPLPDRREPAQPKQRSQKQPRRSAEVALDRRERSLDAARIYSRAISGHHLLTKSEEIALAQGLEDTELEIWTRVLASPLAAEARRQLRLLDPPIVPATDAEARAGDLDRLIASRVIAEGRDQLSKEDHAALRALEVEADRIRGRFAECNLRMVPSVIRKHGYQFTTHLTMGDLIQEGNLGLLKAIPRFDYRRGFRFSTYATWWIRHFVVRARQNQGSDVRVPVHLQDLMFRVRRAQTQLARELGRDPTRKEIAKELRVSEKNLQLLESNWLRHRQTMPMFDSVGDGEGQRPSKFVSDAEPVDQVLVQLQEDEKLVAMVDSLPSQLALVLRSRFGIGGDDPKTLDQIGAMIDRSKERVRQLLEKGLGLLRVHLPRSMRPDL